MSEQDIVERLRAEVVPCPGRGLDGHGMRHCAECCFGSGIEASNAADLRIMLLARDAADQIERLRALADRLAGALAAVKADRPTAHTHEVWTAVCDALDDYGKARRER